MINGRKRIAKGKIILEKIFLEIIIPYFFLF